MAEMDPQTTENKETTGFRDRLRSPLPDILKNNAPRVVAGLKILGCSAMFFSKNRVFSVAGAGFITAFSVIALFGGKKSEEEKEKLRKELEAKGVEEKSRGRVSEYFMKLLHPRRYPLESGTGIAMMSSALWTISSATGKDGFSPGRLLGGGLSFASDANIVFTKEEMDAREINPHPKGSADYYMTELKHRPVLLSSLFNIGSDIASIVGGAHEWRKGKESNTLVAGGFLLAANTFQAMFVDKNDYNIERKATGATPTDQATIQSVNAGHAAARASNTN